ncbi:MAG TPA: MFS transporter [Methanomassiliicoccales archaeon]|nr:MFS transporter [Methanomassiliicoccales archaeon]
MRKDDPLFVYVVNQTMHWFIIGLTLPIIILYMISKGLDLFQAGLVLSVYSGTVILLELPTGGLGDAIGRKRVYMYSLAMSLVSGVVLLFASGLLWFVLGFVFYGVARALSSGSMDAWFVDEFGKTKPAGDLQTALAKANIFIPLGIGAGSLIGGLLPMLTSDLAENVSWMNRYSVNLLLLIVMVLVQMGLTITLVRETTLKEGGRSLLQGFKTLPQVLSDALAFGIRDRFTLVLMISSLFMGFGLLSVELLWQPQVLGLMGDPTETWIFGVLAAGYFFASALGNMVATRLVPWFGRDHLLLLTIVRAVSGATLVILAWQQGLLEFAIVYLLLYLIFGVASSPHAAVFNARIPSERRSTLMSFESLMLQSGGMLGSLFIGTWAKLAGISSAWTVAGLILLLSSLTYGYLYWVGKKAKGRSMQLMTR